MDPDQTARMRMLVLIHAGCKPIMLVLSWRGLNYITVTGNISDAVAEMAKELKDIEEKSAEFVVNVAQKMKELGVL
jgi:hypothetical protein